MGPLHRRRAAHVGRLDGDDRILLTTGPRGETFLTRGHEDSDELTVHRTSDLAELGTLRTGDLSAAGADAGWDFGCGTVDDSTVVVSTSDTARARRTSGTG